MLSDCCGFRLRFFRERNWCRSHLLEAVAEVKTWRCYEAAIYLTSDFVLQKEDR
jgi:hypothetical protein